MLHQKYGFAVPQVMMPGSPPQSRSGRFLQATLGAMQANCYPELATIWVAAD